MAKTIKQRVYESEERAANGLVYRRILLSKRLDEILTRIAMDLKIDRLSVRGFPMDKGDKNKALALTLGSIVENHFGDLIEGHEASKKGHCGIFFQNGRFSVVRY